jgi:hypothetical protein
VLAILVACAALAVARLDRANNGNGNGNASTTLPRASTVTPATLASRALPAVGGSPFLSVVGGHLIESDSEYAGFAHGRVTGTCAAATIDPGTLRVLASVRGSCGNPALFGQRVIPIIYVPNPSNRPGWGTNALVIRISTVDRTVPRGYTVGPVIVTYPDCSDCRAETIYGDGSLWVYAPMTNPHSPVGLLLRVSQATGRVVERWRTPQILRALLATDSDGLWFAPSIESGFPSHATSAEALADGSLYHVTPGVGALRRVAHSSSEGDRWLAATGHTVWLDVKRTGKPRAPLLWRFDGASASPTVRAAPAPRGSRECGDFGDGSVTVVGSAAGVYCVTTNAYSQSVSWLAGDGHAGGTVVRAAAPMRWDFADNAVGLDGSYYFIDPPASAAPVNNAPDVRQGAEAARIYRVTPRA